MNLPDLIGPLDYSMFETRPDYPTEPAAAAGCMTRSAGRRYKPAAASARPQTARVWHPAVA